jgi:hypothetical protein
VVNIGHGVQEVIRHHPAVAQPGLPVMAIWWIICPAVLAEATGMKPTGMGQTKTLFSSGTEATRGAEAGIQYRGGRVIEQAQIIGRWRFAGSSIALS